MTELIPATNDLGFKTFRLSDEELHQKANKQLLEANNAISGTLPSLIDQIIKHRIWASRPGGCKTFAEYALCQNSNGLNINNNHKLWMLQQSMDVDGKHLEEWSGLLEQVEGLVRLQITTSGSKISDFAGNSLKALSKKSAFTLRRITYLPSGNTKDSLRLKLRKQYRDLYQRVKSGEIKLQDALRKAGLGRRDPVNLITWHIKRLSKKNIHRLVEWLHEEGYIS